VTLAVAAVLLLCVWTVSELRTKTPLIDVRAVRHPAVAGANIAMFVGGSGMYLLLTLITRYAQTPHSAGYGFGLTTFVAGLVLIPFSVLGFGVGSFSAAMPGVILAVTPKSETSSAMSFNYVVRSVGYSLGSAIGGLVLAAGTATGRLFPNDDAYTTAALIGVAAMAITTMASLALARRRLPETNPITAPAGVPGLDRSSRTGS